MAETLVEQIERQIRSAIISSEFPPASRLRVAALIARYQTGATPIREALSRLSGEGLVELTTRQGFKVPGVSRDDLVDLLAARTAVEVEATRLSILNGDDLWEAGIVAALHRFRNQVMTGESDEKSSIDIPAHDDLHMAMTAAGNSPRLAELQQRLLLQHKRYLGLSAFRYTRESYLQEHVDLAEVILARNVDAATVMIRQHLALSLDGLDRQGFWTR